jgi:hypothetical protein
LNLSPPRMLNGATAIPSTTRLSNISRFMSHSAALHGHTVPKLAVRRPMGLFCAETVGLSTRYLPKRLLEGIAANAEAIRERMLLG